MMKDCGNEGLDDTNKNTTNDGIDPENEDVIHRDKMKMKQKLIGIPWIR